jgi:hypothetical protein
MGKRDAKTIEIDLDVYKRIEAARESFDETENDILRRELKLGPAKTLQPSVTPEGGLNIGYGVFLPNGTQLQRLYKGKLYRAEVKGGKIWVHGKSFTSPSGSAIEVTKSSVNGWRFWDVKRPDDKKFKLLIKLRHKYQTLNSVET